MQFLEHLAVPIRQIDAAGTILWANQAELDVLGYARDEYVGHHIAEFHVDRAAVDEMCLRIANGEPLRDYEARFIAKGGEVRYLSVTSNAYTRDGKLVHTRCVSRDVTETRRKEAEREERLAELTRTVRLNEMFASILGHDLRNPLNAIAMATQMLLGQVSDPKAQRAAQRVLSSSDRMRRMIDQLLDFSRTRMLGGLPLERKDADLATIVRDALEEARFVRPSWPIELTTEGDTHGSCDAARLAQVMSNLFGNAAQHGAPEVPLVVRLDGTQADRVTLTVTNGGSIPPDVLPMIFAPFRGRKYTDAKTQGLGLGLFISEQIVRAHQGEITAMVSDDMTTFKVSLPRRPVAATATFERLPAKTAEMAPLAPPRKPAEDVMRTFVRSIRDYAIFMLDANGYIQTWNVGAQVTTGYRQDEAVGRHFSIFYTQEDLERGKIPYELDVAQREGQYEEEGWRVRNDGSRYWASVLITALRDDDNQIVGYAKVVRDLTERKLIEERAQLDEERFRILVESVTDYAIFMLDPDGNVASWNAGAERIKGYAADEIVGRHFSAFYPEEDIRAGKCEMELEVATREGRFEDEGWRLRKDGSRFWANVIITPLFDSNGALVGFGKVTRDLTERKQHEEERVRLAQAQEAVRLRDEFLSIASHELKTPLTVLQLQLETLRERVKESDASLAEKIERTTRMTDRLTQLVDTLLDVSRIATGRFDLHREPLDLSQIATEVVDRMSLAASAASCEIHVELLPRVEGQWDRIRIEQILTSLLGNAIKYAAGTSVDLRVFNEPASAVIEVRDRGPGLPAENEALFGRFERGASMRHYGGLGLGLYIVRQIAEAHGGNVVATNAPDGGALFSVRLPRTESN